MGANLQISKPCVRVPSARRGECPERASLEQRRKAWRKGVSDVAGLVKMRFGEEVPPCGMIWGQSAGQQSRESQKFLNDKRFWMASFKYRRERDSNPRYGYPHTRFPSVLLKPLGHLSKSLHSNELSI